METNARTRTAWTYAVAAQIRAERAASGLTQREVIEASGLPKSTYLRLESGERVADVQQLAAFTAAVGVSLSVFMGRAEARLADVDAGQVDERPVNVGRARVAGRSAKASPRTSADVTPGA